MPSNPDDVWVDAVADALEPSKRVKGGTMFDPRAWKPEHRIALVVCMIAGALIGLMVGFVLDRGFGWTFGTWLARNSGEAVLWTITGALTVGAAIYAWRSFSRGDHFPDDGTPKAKATDGVRSSDLCSLPEPP